MYIDKANFAKLSEPTDEENDMLDLAFELKEKYVWEGRGGRGEAEGRRRGGRGGGEAKERRRGGGGEVEGRWRGGRGGGEVKGR